MDWVVLYADGSEFGSSDGGPEDAPRWGVMAVIQADVASGARWESSPIGQWGWRGGAWVGFEDHMGLWDYIGNSRDWNVILSGRTLKDEAWELEVKRITKRVLEIQKSGWRARERRP